MVPWIPPSTGRGRRHSPGRFDLGVQSLRRDRRERFRNASAPAGLKPTGCRRLLGLRHVFLNSATASTPGSRRLRDQLRNAIPGRASALCHFTERESHTRADGGPPAAPASGIPVATANPPHPARRHLSTLAIALPTAVTCRCRRAAPHLGPGGPGLRGSVTASMSSARRQRPGVVRVLSVRSIARDAHSPA